MPYCVIIVCKNDSRTKNVLHGGVSYHRFPKDPDIKNRWILACGRKNWFPTKTSTICSAHFHPTDYVEKSKCRRILSQSAYPTIDVWRTENSESAHDASTAHSNNKTANNDPGSSPLSADAETIQTHTQSESSTVKRLMEQRSRLLAALKFEKMKVKKFRDQLRRKTKQNDALRFTILQLKKKLSKKIEKSDDDTKYI